MPRSVKTAWQLPPNIFLLNSLGLSGTSAFASGAERNNKANEICYTVKSVQPALTNTAHAVLLPATPPGSFAAY